MPELPEELRRIFDLWNDTEERIKEAERLRAEVVVPSIKELRYAGRWLIDVLGVLIPLVDDRLNEKQREQLSKALFEAEQNCVRAKNDAVDASVLFLHRRLEQMVQEFGVPIVFSYFSDYPAMRAKMREVDEIITDSRGNGRQNRNDFYDHLAKNHLPELIAFYQKMRAYPLDTYTYYIWDRHARPCAGHPRLFFQQTQRRGWPGQARP